MRKRRFFILKLLLPALAVGAIIANPYGVRSKLFHILYPPRANPDRLSESAIDTDDDGQLDVWEVDVRSFEPTKCRYTLKDRDHDGTPDELTVVLGKITSKMFDDDNDRSFDRLEVEIAHGSDENHRYRYQDLDLDGRFDIMAREYVGKPVATHLFMNETLVKAESFLTHDLKVAWIESAESGRQRAVFENGDWHIRR